jgi:hypothetical protein
MRLPRRTYNGEWRAFPSFSDIKQGDSGRNRAANMGLTPHFQSSL